MPEQERAQATVESILEAVVHVLVKHGSEGATVQAIARRAGVSVGSLYQYFATKDALIAACAERETRLSVRRLESGVPALFSLSLRDAASAAIRGLITNSLVNEALWRALLERRQQLEGFNLFQERAASLIHLYLERRPCRQLGADPATAAFVLVHAVKAVLERALLKGPEQLRSELFASELTRLVVSYLSPWGDDV
jgi:AcrR family transcriptional regulator